MIENGWPGFDDEEEMNQFLNDHGVNTSQWGEGDSKTVGHLLSEIRDGSSKYIFKEGKLLRQLQAVSVDIYFRGCENFLIIQ